MGKDSSLCGDRVLGQQNMVLGYMTTGQAKSLYQKSFKKRFLGLNLQRIYFFKIRSTTLAVPQEHS